MKLAPYIVSVILGLGVVAMAGHHEALTRALLADVAQFAAAAIYTAGHVFIWSFSHWVFKVGRWLVWLGYAALVMLFFASYYPNGIVPVFLLLVSGITLPVLAGFAAVALPAWLSRRFVRPPVTA